MQPAAHLHFEAVLLEVIIDMSRTDFLVVFTYLWNIAGAVQHENVVRHLGPKRVKVVQCSLEVHVKVCATVWWHQRCKHQVTWHCDVIIRALCSHREAED